MYDLPLAFFQDIGVLYTYTTLYPKDTFFTLPKSLSGLLNLLEDLKKKPSSNGDHYDTKWDEIYKAVRDNT